MSETEIRLTDTNAILGCAIPAVIGLIWTFKEVSFVKSIEINGKAPAGKSGALLGSDLPEETVMEMKDIAELIRNGAIDFLNREYQYMFAYIFVFSFILVPMTDKFTWIAFIVGSLTSMLCGYCGMMIAVLCNVRTSHESWKGLKDGFAVALRGGSIMGFMLVSLGVLCLLALILAYRNVYDFDNLDTTEKKRNMFEALAGYGLGGSSIALFGRVGGGIYTKAADVGADLSGKNSFGMDEDDKRNPACIADNVGDNVGDVAGMGADLFGSFAESTCAAMVLAMADGSTLANCDFAAVLFPLLLSSSGIVVGLITVIIVTAACPVNSIDRIESTLRFVLILSTILQTPAAGLVCWVGLPNEFALSHQYQGVLWWHIFVCIACGLWSGLIIGYFTEVFTSHSYSFVRQIANQQKTSAATGIIYGLAVGYESCIIPIFCIGGTVCVSHILGGMYGVSMGALGMLGTLTMGLTIDVYGPISDNAGGIAEMAEMKESLGMGADGKPEMVRTRTDALDAAGNTTAAIGKGFAIGSAAMVSLALFGAYCTRAQVTTANILDSWTFTGLLFGAMMPYWFSAMTMKSVGKAATQMCEECLRQFPDILNPEINAKPDYKGCIAISTDASIKEMFAPGILVIASPLIAGVALGKNCTAGLLSGALVSGVQLAISMSNTGGAWDNAKKYIEGGHMEGYAKGSDAHKNAVTGDTVGDPLKDTSGPSLNILVKLSAIMSLVFGSVIAQHSNDAGGPWWLTSAN